MHIVVFEVTPREQYRDNYLELAARLREELEQIDGFISVERFQSLTEPGKLLSLSVWRDDAAIAAWRENRRHRAAQARGDEYFADYRIRVAQVMRDYAIDTPAAQRRPRAD